MTKFHDLKHKWQMVIYLLPILLVILLLKYMFHELGWEIISLNALFTSIVAATTFLLGFLIAGVIADYKESEKIPGDLACSLEAIYDEASILHSHKRCVATEEFMTYYSRLLVSINAWFHKKERTQLLMQELRQMNEFFYRFEPLTQANFIVRMKQEQSSIRRIITRTHTIRETSFIQSGYAIVEALAVLLIFGLLLLKMEPVYESMFIAGMVSFLVLYMILLIKALDNPFNYAEHEDSINNVSLKPLHDLMKRVGAEQSSESGSTIHSDTNRSQ
jgi:hypothetical protein